MVELHYISATEALEKFKNKTLSPVELIKADIDLVKIKLLLTGRNCLHLI